MLFFWLKKGAEKTIEGLQRRGVFSSRLQVKVDEDSGKAEIHVYGDPFDPTTELPEIPEELIEKVTVKEHRIYRGFRTEGVYSHEGATLMLTTFSDVVGAFSEERVERNEHQSISISAPSVKALKTIFTMVRQGLLKPSEDWEGYPSQKAEDEKVN